MPSIPQSLLWISLVVLWLFVLVPMLISKRDNVRRTSDVALATRVLNGHGRSGRLLRKRGPAAGHYSDPDWQPSDDDYYSDDEFDGDESDTAPRKTIVLAANEENTDSLYLDVDIVEEDSGALPVGVSAVQQEEPELTLDLGLDDVADAPRAGFEEEFEEAVEDFEREADRRERVASAVPLDATQAIRTVTEADFEAEDVEDLAEVAETEAEAEDEPDGTDHDYEYVDDSSGLEAPDDADEQVASLSKARSRRFESATAAKVSARKFQFRKRMLLGMAVALLASAVVAFVVTPAMWWACGAIGAITLLYLGYLRRQTRIEEQLRRRRAQRMARSRLGVENTEDTEFDVVPSRLRRPGSVVLEIDDEDPIFEHLEYASYEREYNLPRASGQ
jgi:hypothetical protein